MDASDTTRNKKAKSFYLFIFSNKSQYKTLISNYENSLNFLKQHLNKSQINFKNASNASRIITQSIFLHFSLSNKILKK